MPSMVEWWFFIQVRNDCWFAAEHWFQRNTHSKAFPLVFVFFGEPLFFWDSASGWIAGGDSVLEFGLQIRGTLLIHLFQMLFHCTILEKRKFITNPRRKSSEWTLEILLISYSITGVMQWFWTFLPAEVAIADTGTSLLGAPRAVTQRMHWLLARKVEREPWVGCFILDHSEVILVFSALAGMYVFCKRQKRSFSFLP